MTRSIGKKIVVQIDADLAELMPVFFRNRRGDIKSILAALDNCDYETIRILGHSMKGSGAGYGFDAISEIGYSIEKAATDRNADQIKKMIQKLSEYIEKVEVVYV